MTDRTTSDLMCIVSILNHIGELSEVDKTCKNISEFLYYLDNVPFNYSLPVLVNIGKASKKISNRIIIKYTKVPWKTLNGFADIYNVDHELFSKTAMHDLINDKLPRMVDVLEKIIVKELNEKSFSFKEYKSLSLSKSYYYVNFKRISAHLLQLQISELIYENTWMRH